MIGYDGLQEILFTIKQNKLRTLLTAFGVFWGILMLILLLGAGTGMQNGVENQFSSDPEDSIWFVPGTTAMPYKGLGPGREIKFTRSDMEAIKQQIPGINYISSENPLGNFTRAGSMVNYGNKSANVGVFGVADEYFYIKPHVEFHFGRKLNPFDALDNRKVAVLGKPIVERIFPPGVDPIGKMVTVNGIALKVIGVFWDKGWEGRLSERLYMPLSAFRKIFGSGEVVNLIAARVAPGYDPPEKEKQVLELLQRRHNISPDDRRAINSWNIADQTRETRAIFTGIDTFIWFVGLGTLMAGIVGVSNIMIITVKDRTREIGVRKALGATPLSIVGTLLIESIMITAIAGYAGLVLGVAILETISYFLEVMNIKLTFFKSPEVNFQVAITALILLVGAGAAAGLWPALKAARIMPVEAMRAE
jgi:putative ABC transport system permease protein